MISRVHSSIKILHVHLKIGSLGTSLVVQWVRLCTPNAGELGSIPGRGTRSRVHAANKSLHATTKKFPHATTKIPSATTKTRCSQNKQTNKYINKYFLNNNNIKK